MEKSPSCGSHIEDLDSPNLIQALLAEITNKSSSSAMVTMPDWEAERDTLFKEKYPCPTKSEGVLESKIRRTVKRPQGRVSVNDSDEVERKRRRRTQPKRYLMADHNKMLELFPAWIYFSSSQ